MRRRDRGHRRGDGNSLTMRYAALIVLPLALVGLIGVMAPSPDVATSDGNLQNAHPVRGELISPAVADDVISLNLLYPTSIPVGLSLVSVVRDWAYGDEIIYLIFDRKPLESGEFDLLDMMNQGGIILLEEPTQTTISEQEAWLDYVIGETAGGVQKVSVNGHVGGIGHGMIPQMRWWQDGLRLIIFGHLNDQEFLSIASSVQPRI